MCVYFLGLSSAFGLFGFVWGFCLSIWVEIALIRNVWTVYWSSKKTNKKKKIQKYSLCCPSHISLFGSQITVITESNVGQTGKLLLCCDCKNYTRHTRVPNTTRQQFWYNGHFYILTVDKPPGSDYRVCRFNFYNVGYFFCWFCSLWLALVSPLVLRWTLEILVYLQ